MKPRLLNRHHREATIQLLYSVCCIVHAMRQLQLQRACSDAQMLLLSVVLSGVVLVVAGEVAQVPHYPRGRNFRVAIPTATDPPGSSRVDTLTHPSPTAACVAAVETR